MYVNPIFRTKFLFYANRHTTEYKHIENSGSVKVKILEGRKGRTKSMSRDQVIL